MAEGQSIYSSKQANHSMMDFVGTSLLPRDFSNMDLFDISNSHYFFDKEKSYYMGDKVIYYVPKFGKEYAEPAQLGWYKAKEDVEAGEFNPDQWIHMTIFNLPYRQDLVQNLAYVNRMHSVQASINMLLATVSILDNDHPVYDVENLNKSEELLLSDFDEMPEEFLGMEIPTHNNRWYKPVVDVALIDFNGNTLTEYPSTVTLTIGYDKQEDGTYAKITQYVEVMNKPDLTYIDTTENTPTGDGKYYLVGIDPTRTDKTTTKYAVFGIYNIIKEG